jgi:hypothetical protein
MYTHSASIIASGTLHPNHNLWRSTLLCHAPIWPSHGRDFLEELNDSDLYPVSLASSMDFSMAKRCGSGNHGLQSVESTRWLREQNIDDTAEALRKQSGESQLLLIRRLSRGLLGVACRYNCGLPQHQSAAQRVIIRLRLMAVYNAQSLMALSYRLWK